MTDQSAGATPVVPGATPGQTTLPAAEEAATPPATGDDGLSDPGRRALDAERAQRRDAEKRAKALADELEALKASQLSEHEKAVAQARTEAAAAKDQEWGARLRRSEVLRELQAAGIAGSLDLASRAPEFEALPVGEDGRVDGLDKAVAAFRSANPYLFGTPRPPAGNFDGGPGGQPSAQQSWTRDQIGSMSQVEYEKSEPEIMRAMREGRIRD